MDQIYYGVKVDFGAGQTKVSQTVMLRGAQAWQLANSKIKPQATLIIKRDSVDLIFQAYVSHAQPGIKSKTLDLSKVQLWSKPSEEALRELRFRSVPMADGTFVKDLLVKDGEIETMLAPAHGPDLPVRYIARRGGAVPGIQNPITARLVIVP